MSESESREWRFYIDDMIECATYVVEFSRGLNQEEFVASRIIYDATIRNLEVIGEAATHIPDSVRSSHPEIPWRQIIATRNRLIHGYLGIDNDTLWSIVETDTPCLLTQLVALRQQIQ